MNLANLIRTDSLDEGYQSHNLLQGLPIDGDQWNGVRLWRVMKDTGVIEGLPIDGGQWKQRKKWTDRQQDISSKNDKS